MEIKKRKLGPKFILKYSKMVQLVNDYNKEVNGIAEYTIPELCKKYKISKTTFHRYLKQMREVV